MIPPSSLSGARRTLGIVNQGGKRPTKVVMQVSLRVSTTVGIVQRLTRIYGRLPWITISASMSDYSRDAFNDTSTNVHGLTVIISIVETGCSTL